MWYNDSAEISSHPFVTSINKYERKDIYGRYVDIESFLWIVTAIMLHKRNVEFRSRASMRRTPSDW